MVRSFEEVEEQSADKFRMIKVSDAYSLEDLCEMDEKDMETLLKFYAPDKVPRLGCLRAMEGEYDAFDGSFGFCVGWG
jgi:precorrin-2 dehydrogenase / sirohydrochlorin ferrochelatase